MSDSHPKFKIVSTITKEDDSYFYSETGYRIEVQHRSNGRVIMTFWGNEYNLRGTETNRGTEYVRFSEDGTKVITTAYDGTKEEHQLPG